MKPLIAQERTPSSHGAVDYIWRTTFSTLQLRRMLPFQLEVKLFANPDDCSSSNRSVTTNEDELNMF